MCHARWAHENPPDSWEPIDGSWDRGMAFRSHQCQCEQMMFKSVFGPWWESYFDPTYIEALYHEDPRAHYDADYVRIENYGVSIRPCSSGLTLCSSGPGDRSSPLPSALLLWLLSTFERPVILSAASSTPAGHMQQIEDENGESTLAEDLHLLVLHSDAWSTMALDPAVDRSWYYLTRAEKAAARLIGFNIPSWDVALSGTYGGVIPERMRPWSWDEMCADEIAAAQKLGFSEIRWNAMPMVHNGPPSQGTPAARVVASDAQVASAKQWLLNQLARTREQEERFRQMCAHPWNKTSIALEEKLPDFDWEQDRRSCPYFDWSQDGRSWEALGPWLGLDRACRPVVTLEGRGVEFHLSRLPFKLSDSRGAARNGAFDSAFDKRVVPCMFYDVSGEPAAMPPFVRDIPERRSVRNPRGICREHGASRCLPIGWSAAALPPMKAEDAQWQLLHYCPCTVGAPGLEPCSVCCRQPDPLHEKLAAGPPWIQKISRNIFCPMSMCLHTLAEHGFFEWRRSSVESRTGVTPVHRVHTRIWGEFGRRSDISLWTLLEVLNGGGDADDCCLRICPNAWEAVAACPETRFPRPEDLSLDVFRAAVPTPYRHSIETRPPKPYVVQTPCTVCGAGERLWGGLTADDPAHYGSEDPWGPRNGWLGHTADCCHLPRQQALGVYGTIRCTLCQQPGHTLRACPQRATPWGDDQPIPSQGRWSPWRWSTAVGCRYDLEVVEFPCTEEGE